MYSSNPNGRPNSWAPLDEHSRGRGPNMWPQDERYRARDDQMISHLHSDRPPIIPSDMNVHPQAQQGEHLYHPLGPPHMEGYNIGAQQMYHHQQPAPRQRTAIACRYCRRRKIRCSGFDSSPDGRCSNCLRFSQECVFTPVSSQTHAFVPAHTQYPHLKQGYPRPDGRSYTGQMYGSHGQPLSMNMLPQQPQHEYMHPGYGRPPSPGSSNPGYQRPYEESRYEHDRDREYLPQSLPPLNPPNAYPPLGAQRRGSAGDYPPIGWRNNQANPPSPSALPLPRQFSPPPSQLHANNNGIFPNGTFPSNAISPQTRGSYPSSEGHQYPGPLGTQHLPVTTTTPSQRRSSDPRDQDTREQRYALEAVPFHPQGPVPSAGVPQSHGSQRSSSAGPTNAANPNANPMNLQNLISDPASLGQGRSAADHKMLSSLAWKP